MEARLGHVAPLGPLGGSCVFFHHTCDRADVLWAHSLAHTSYAARWARKSLPQTCNGTSYTGNGNDIVCIWWRRIAGTCVVMQQQIMGVDP